MLFEQGLKKLDFSSGKILGVNFSSDAKVVTFFKNPKEHKKNIEICIEKKITLPEPKRFQIFFKSLLKTIFLLQI